MALNCSLSPVKAFVLLLALSQFTIPARGSRSLLLTDKERAKQAADAAFLEAQQAELVAQQQAELQKLQDMADEHRVREQQQEAEQLSEAAQNAREQGAADVEQQQLADKAEEAAWEAQQAAEELAEREARREARRAERRRGKSKSARLEEEGAEVAARAADSAQPSNAGSAGWGIQTSTGARGGKGSVYATYHYYSPEHHVGSLYCADAFRPYVGDGPVPAGHWLLRYPWTAYCNTDGLGPMSQNHCGRCLKVTNPATGQSVKVRVVDMCGNSGIDMDSTGFNAIDGNGAGVRDGHMDVNIEWCSE